MFVFVSSPLLFPNKGDMIWAFSSKYKIDQSDFTDWKSALKLKVKMIESSNREIKCRQNMVSFAYSSLIVLGTEGVKLQF